MNPPVIPSLAKVELEFHCDDGPVADWIVGAAQIDESIDRPFLATLDLLCTVADGDGFLGANFELLFLRDDERRRLYGLVSAVEALGKHDLRYVFRLTLEPAFALLRLGQNSRIWQGRSVQDVVKAVLDKSLAVYGRNYDFGSVTRGGTPRLNCVQFRESDLDFVDRLLQEEGISYRFVHGEGPYELLTFADANNQYPDFENVDGSSNLTVISTDFEHADLESIQTIKDRRQLTVTSALQRDFDWLMPSELLTSAAGRADERGRDRRVYRHGRRRFEADDLAERARDIVEAEAVEGIVLRCKSNVAGLVPGQRISIFADEVLGLDGDYLVIAVLHTSHAEQLYTNSFECVPLESPLRPRARTSAPRVHGPQTAIVVGGEEIHTDEHGRIQVQFHWEEHPSYASEASCWVPCAQSWSGPGWGAQFIPRRGMEVVVEFLEGNPDRPLVTGCIYDGRNGPPFPMPGDKTQSGWRTSSVPGGAGSNELRFDDAAGAEEIYIHAQKNFNEVVLAKHSTTVHANQTNQVGGSQTNSVSGNQNESIDGSQSQSVGGNQSVCVDKNRIVTVQGSQSVTILGAAAAAGVTGSKLTITGDYKLDTSNTIEIQAPTHILLSCGGSSIEMVPGKITLCAGGEASLVLDANVRMQSSVGSKVELDANARVQSSGGGKVELDANALMQSNDGSKVKLDAGALMQSKHGSRVKLNANARVRSSGGSKVALNDNVLVQSSGGSKVELDAAGVAIEGSKIDLNT